MIRLDDLLARVGKALVPDVTRDKDPLELAEAHLKAASGKAPSPRAADPHTSLFSAEVLPGERVLAPSSQAMARVLALVKDPEPSFKMVLRWAERGLEVLSWTGQWLDPQPLTTRGAAAGQDSQRSHTFSHLLPPWRAVVGLEAEENNHFGLTLTLESDTEAAPFIRATLWDGERRRAVQTGRGAICVEGLPSGQYRLELVAAGEQVGDIHLVVEDQEPAGDRSLGSP